MDTNNKLSNNHQLQRKEEKKKEFANFDQSEPSNARKTNTKQDKQEEHKLFDNNSLNAAGLRSSLHGNIYQLNLLMLFLQTALDKNYDFELYSEEKDAEKFDDIIFKYVKDESTQYRLLQAKHKISKRNPYIEIKELCSNNAKLSFSLQKYFHSFRKIEQNQKYKSNINDLIICTNIDFSNDIKDIRFVKEEKPDDILNQGEQYKIIFEKNNDIVEKLKDIDLIPDLKELAKKLAEKVLKKDYLDLNNKPFVAYKVTLEKEMFDINNEKTIKLYTFKKNFINDENLSNEAKLLRRALEREGLKLIKDKNDFWNKADNKKFTTSGKNIKAYKGIELGIEEKQLPNVLVSDNEIKKFFDKLVFAVKQPNAKELEKFIQKKICDSLDNLHLKDHQQTYQAEIIYNYVLRKMLDWLNNSKSTPLSNKDNFFKQAKESLNDIMFNIPFLEWSSILKYNYIEKLNIEFKSEKIEEINRFLNSKDSNIKILNLISSEKDIYLSQAKIYQINQRLGWPLETLLNLERLENQIESVFKCNLLIIVCENESQTLYEHIEELYNKLINSIKNNENKQIILITQGNSILANFFKEGNLKNKYKELPDITKVTDLDKTYLKEKLLKKIIKFQNQERKLADLIDIESKKLDNNELSEEEINILEKVITSEILSELILDKNIIVSNKASFTDSNSPYHDPYYIDIPRTFDHQIIDKDLLKNCIKERKEDIFTFSSVVGNDINILKPDKESKIIVFDETDNISDEDISKERFFILSDRNPERNFQKLSANNKKNVHWLKCIDNKFIVEYSNRLCNLRDCIKKKVIKIEDLKKEIENSSIVIIVGDAGVGKSTILTYFQKFDTFSWPIRINLKNYQKYLKNANFNNLQEIIEFLCQSDLIVGLETTLAKNLLKHYLEYSDKIILLLDGYDEIKDDCQEKIIQLLRFFKNEKRKIWLTSRNEYKIEDALGTFAFSYSLNPFDIKLQENFLKQYWIKKQNIEKLDQEKKNDIDKFTKEVLEQFHKLGLIKENGLIGIVLQTRMVADIFYSEYKLNLSNIRINNISDLYEKFIKFQYNKYFKEKIKLLDECSQNVLTNTYTKAYGYLALNALFSTDQLCTQLLTEHKIYSENKFLDTLSCVGFLKSFRDNHVKNFIHCTYAEYFVAKLSINMLKKNTDYYKYKTIRKFLLRNIFLDRNKLIHTFLSEIQKRCNNNDIKNKWKAIQDCDLLREIKIERMLELFNSTSLNNNNINTDVVSKKTLSELKKEVESCMYWFTVRLYRGNNIYCDVDVIYYFNGNKNLVKKLFQKFLEETDIEELETALEFLVKTRWNFSNNMRTYHDNIINMMDDTFLELMYQKYMVINHYLVQAKLQNKPNAEVNKMISDLKEYIFPIEKENIEHFMRLLDKFIKVKNSPNETRKEKYLQDLVLLIPNHSYHAGDFRILNNNIYYLLNKCDQNAINDINSTKILQKSFKERILLFLENSKCPVWESQLSDALPNTDIKYLQSFFINITHHPTIITDTKSSINEIYLRRKNDLHWLGREGVLIFRFLKILTSEMSKVFINASSADKYVVFKYYSYGVFYDFIIYIIDILETEELPHIDKLAFFNMIVHFANTVLKIVQCLRFKSNQLKTTLRLLQTVLNEQHRPAHEVLEDIVKYLLTLKMAGLKLIDIADQKILILDPVSEFQFELSTNYKNQIIELMKKTYNKYIVKSRKEANLGIHKPIKV